MSQYAPFPITRMRRLRSSPVLRHMLRETQLTVNDFILPLFIHHGTGIKNPIASMPGHFQLSIDNLETEIGEIQALGIPAVILFGIPEHKDATGSDAFNDKGLIQTAIQHIKELAPNLMVISDVCFCEYTDHGHCGVMTTGRHGLDLDNDKTLEVLTKQVISHARAGSDMIAPSGMLDGMVTAIRHALDGAGFEDLPIMSYAVKYASAFYGPFRDAAQGAPEYGDRSSYQMDPANSAESLKEAALDVQEGADLLMVKPALSYLDIISQVKRAHPATPLVAYNVSGEFAMLKAAAEKGWLDEKRVVLEALTSIKRAGADIIITYHAKEVASWL